MAEGETIDDLIQKAGGYTAHAYPFGSVYQNVDAKMVNIKAKEVLYHEFLDNIMAISEQPRGGEFDIAPIIGLAKEVKNTKSNGRVVVDLFDEGAKNLYSIKDGDELFVPEKNNVVYVYGEVSNEGGVMYSPDQDLDYFIKKSGGYKKFANFKSIYVLHPNGESELYSKRRNIFENSPESMMKIYPGSIIFVPRELDESVPRRLAAQAYISILGNLGLGLASLSSINNN